MRLAAITMAYNELIFLPIWVDYYGLQLGYENLYVVDHGSNDDSISHATRNGSHIVRIEQKELDEEYRAKYISQLHRQLLKDYDAVLYADADEFIIPDPATGLSLSAYIREKLTTHINVLGLNVIHNIAQEAKLDFDQPLFKQRSYAQFDIAYCKPMIAKVPIEWGPGFHFSSLPRKQASDLFMFHLRAMDIDIAKERLRNYARIKFSRNALEKRHSAHFLLPEEHYIELLFSISNSEFASACEDLEFSFEMFLLSTFPLKDLSNYRGRMFRIPHRFWTALPLRRKTAQK
jgi:glycosyltransferase involved in cell wall biosynthesis